MKSDTIQIDNQGNGFAEAVQETKKVAQFRGITHKEALQLQLMTEEMLSLIHSVTGEVKASFWVESEGKAFDLCLTTKTELDPEKRYLLISSSSSRKNDTSGSFLGRLREAFEKALAEEVEDYSYSELPDDAMNDVYNRCIDDPEWDRYEQSILLRLSDNVKISIRGKQVRMTVSKQFI